MKSTDPYNDQSRAVEWQTFQTFLRDIDRYIEDGLNINQKDYAIYQTLIAIGGYFGPIISELLSIQWAQIYGPGSYIFTKEVHRQPLVIEPELRMLINRNYEIIKPPHLKTFILIDPKQFLNRPAEPEKFNTDLSRLFTQFDIMAKKPFAMTLRKTFARKVLLDNNTENFRKELAFELQISRQSLRSFIKL